MGARFLAVLSLGLLCSPAWGEAPAPRRPGPCPSRCLCSNVGRGRPPVRTPAWRKAPDLALTLELLLPGAHYPPPHPEWTLPKGTEITCVGLTRLPTFLPLDTVSLTAYGEESHHFSYQPRYRSEQQNPRHRHLSHAAPINSPPAKLTRINKLSVQRSRHLKEVTIVGNNIVVIHPFEFSVLGNLVTLNLRRNHIRYVSSAAFYGLYQLEELQLSNNEIAYLPPGTFRDTRRLRNLYLNKNVLMKIHLGLFHPLVSLKTLDISSNNLTDLPPSVFSRNVKLQKLVLDDNVIGVLHFRWLQHLSGLRVLSVQRNRISQLPQSLFGVFTKLEELYLAGNRIKFLDGALFSQLSRLRILDLSNNTMERLPRRSIGNLLYLEQLYLGGNELSGLSSRPFLRLPSLKKLILSHNRLENIDSKSVQVLSGLEMLDLSFNRIKKISKGTFMGLSRLNELKLENNSISVIEDKGFSVNSLSHLSQLTWLSLQSNDLRSLSAKSLHGMHHLKFLNLAYNKIRKIHQKALSDLPKLHTLSLNNNAITSLKIGQFQSQERLVHLNLAHNGLKSLVEGSFSGLKSLEQVKLTFNRIRQIEQEAFRDIPKLISFELKGNDLHVFDFHTVGYLRRLHYVDLSRNRLVVVRVPRRLSPYVVHLNLEANNLRTLTENVTRLMVPGGMLGLSNNPWSCDCKLRWVKEYSKARKIRLGYEDSAYCKEPEQFLGRKILSVSESDFYCKQAFSATRGSTYRKYQHAFRCSRFDPIRQFSKKDFREYKKEVVAHHVTIFDQRKRPVCNGVLLTAIWILTTATCVQSQFPAVLSQMAGGNDSVTIDVRTTTNENHHVRRVVVQPRDGDFALLELGRGSPLFEFLPAICIPTKEEFRSMTARVKKGVFSARVDGRKSRSKLRSIGGRVKADLCNNGDGVICLKIRQRKNPDNEIFTLGSPVYFGRSRSWRLAGLGTGYMSTSNKEKVKHFFPLWNATSWLDEVTSSL